MYNSVNDKYRKLINILKNIDKDNIVIAFSGGVDSSLLTAIAVRTLGYDRVTAITIDMPFIPRHEIEWSKNIARTINVKHIILRLEINDPRIWSNPPNRCYLCKKMVFGKIIEYAKRNLRSYVIMDATNADDLKKYRPGIKALKELGIMSPLAMAGLSKSNIRLLAKSIGLPNWNQPSSPCLATRIPYGEKITLERLRRIEEAEKIIKEYVGARTVRVRDHGIIARIEVGRKERKLFFNEDVMDKIYNALRELGYIFVTLDLYGYREGSIDEALNKEKHSS